MNLEELKKIQALIDSHLTPELENYLTYLVMAHHLDSDDMKEILLGFLVILLCTNKIILKKEEEYEPRQHSGIEI